MSYVLGIIAVLIGALFFQRSKLKQAESVADNFDILKELNKLSVGKSKNDGLIEAEENKREQIKKEASDAKKNTEGDADFFNKR